MAVSYRTAVVLVVFPICFVVGLVLFFAGHHENAYLLLVMVGLFLAAWVLASERRP
jgi:hypothetical protein